MPTNSDAAAAAAPARLDAYSGALLTAAVLCVTVAELLFKRGAAATLDATAAPAIFGISVLASGWTWLGIVAYLGSFVAWLAVLKRLPLHLAFNLMSVSQALVPLGAWACLGEEISPRRWAGVALVLIGIIVIARPAMTSEEKL